MKKEIEMKAITFARGYYITTEGKILNRKKDGVLEECTPFIRSGYYYIGVKTDADIAIEIAIHELTAKTFIPIPLWIREDEPVINHFDLNKLNNRVDNLEWVTRSWNAIHHHLMTTDNTRSDSSWITATNPHGELRFYSLQQAADYFRVSRRVVWEELKVGGMLNGYVLHYRNKIGRTETRKIANKSVTRNIDEFGKMTSVVRAIKIMDLKTGEIKDFSSMNEAARHFGVKLTHIRNRLSTPELPKVFNKQYVIIDSNKNFDFLTSHLKNELMNRGSKKIVVCDKRDNSIKVYNSARNFTLNHSGYPSARAVVAARLKDEKIIQFKEYYIANLPESEEHNPDLYMITQIATLKR